MMAIVMHPGLYCESSLRVEILHLFRYCIWTAAGNSGISQELTVWRWLCSDWGWCSGKFVAGTESEVGQFLR